MKKILICALKSVCYNSYLYFEDRLGSELEKLGCEVTYFRASEEPIEHLERYAGASFDAVLEFNSDLPKIKMDDGSYFLDHIQAPFYDVLLDHPLYHHDMLKQQLMDFHVICLDINHRDYILKNYPHIKSVDVVSITGESAAICPPMAERSTDVLFLGTYTSPAEVYDAIEHCPPFLAADIKKLIDRMLLDPRITLEDAVTGLIPETDSLIAENFPLHMQAYFLADTYIRAFLREKLIRTLSDAGVPLSVYGGDWEKMPPLSGGNVSFHAGVPYADTFSLMADAKITLNIMPLFKNGSHDRIPSAMLNKSVAVTDRSDMLTRLYQDGTDLVFYDTDHMELLPQQIFSLLSDEQRLSSIAEAGYKNAKKNATWETTGQRFFDILYKNGRMSSV